MKHKLIETGDADSYRAIEDANGEVVLAQCRVCGCAEGEIPTECPGHKVDYQYRQAIYAGELDFKDDAWQVKK